VELALSADGKRWNASNSSKRAGTSLLTADTSSSKKFAQVDEFWVRITVKGSPGSKAAPIASIDNLTIAANPPSSAPPKSKPQKVTRLRR
jgi:hypothetical protein